LPNGGFLQLEGSDILVIDPERKKRDDERTREKLTRWARFDPQWHRAELLDAQQQGNPFAAAFHAEKLLREQPYDARLHLERAYALADLGRPTEAATHLMHALFLHPRVELHLP
jgi:Flp pilus assembly protein TadD